MSDAITAAVVAVFIWIMLKQRTELRFATLELRDEATERQFLQTLRQMGVPIRRDET